MRTSISSTADAAALLGVSATRVRQMIKTGRLPAINLSGPQKRPFYVIRSSDIEAFMAKPRKPGRPPKDVDERLRALDVQAVVRTGRQSGKTRTQKRRKREPAAKTSSKAG